MLISTKELRDELVKLLPSETDQGDSWATGVSFGITKVLQFIAGEEAKFTKENPEVPMSFGCDKEHALIVYCTPKLYEFTEKFEKMQNEDKDISLIDVGKVWLEVKKFLNMGRFKRI